MIAGPSGGAASETVLDHSISSWCSSASVDIVTRGASKLIPGQAAGSSIHAATATTTPGAAST
jgi:hypothetical protein